jgi:Cupredoxin-like domain
MNSKSKINRVLGLVLTAWLSTTHATQSYAADFEANLAIENHEFSPKTLKVPANTRVKLTIINLDPSAEEFESHALNREKVIPGKTKAVIYIGPLNPGQYSYFGEFNPKTAQGIIVAE